MQLVSKVVRLVVGTPHIPGMPELYGGLSLTYTLRTPAVSTLIKINPHLYIMLCRLFSVDNCVRKELGVRLKNHQELQVR